MCRNIREILKIFKQSHSWALPTRACALAVAESRCTFSTRERPRAEPTERCHAIRSQHGNRRLPRKLRLFTRYCHQYTPLSLSRSGSLLQLPSPSPFPFPFPFRFHIPRSGVRTTRIPVRTSPCSRSSRGD
jgi:hypothetical protein